MNPIQTCLLSFLMTQEAKERDDRNLDQLKQRVFASAFGSFHPNEAMKHYYEAFEKETEKPPDEESVEEFTPESEADVQDMLNAARRAGAVD